MVSVSEDRSAPHLEIADQVSRAIEADRIAVLRLCGSVRSAGLVTGDGAPTARAPIGDVLSALLENPAAAYIDRIVSEITRQEGIGRIDCILAGHPVRCTASPTGSADTLLVIEPRRDEDPRAAPTSEREDVVANAGWLAAPDLSRFEVRGAAWATISGRSAGTVYRSSEEVLKDIHPEDRSWFADTVRRIEEQRRIEYRIVRPDGNIRCVQSWLTPIRGEDGTVVEVAASSRDLTDHRFVEEALRESEERLRLITDSIREVFWISDPSFDRLYFMSAAYEEIWGAAIGEAYRDPRSMIEAIHEDDRTVVLDTIDRAAAGRSAEIEFRLPRSSGVIRWLRMRAFPVFDHADAVYRLTGIVEDVTGRRRAEDALAAAEAHYRRLVEQSPYGIYAVDMDGRFTEVNPALARILGRKVDDVLGHPVETFVASESRSSAEDAYQGWGHRAQTITSSEFAVLLPDGTRRLVHVHASAIQEDGAVVGTHGVARDVTEEREREHQEKLLSSALEGLTEEGVSIVDSEGNCYYTNPAYVRIIGADPAGPPVRGPDDFLPDEEARRQHVVIGEVLARDGAWSGRVQRTRMDGQVIPLDLTVGVVSAPDGRELYFSIIRDVAEKIAREGQLRRAERLASLGTLLSGVAHELNNPLTSIKSFAQLMLMDQHRAEDREALETMQREANRAAKIVADLRTIARESQETERGAEKGPVDLNDVVRHVLKLRRYALDTHNIQVQENLVADLPAVLGDRGQLEQVVINLFVNAEHALRSLSEEARSVKRIIVRTRRSSKGVSLAVVDNGPGILPEYVDRIFDPFWTTKKPGEGTGLGLSLIHTIVSEHRGEIRVDSEPRLGAAFTVDLPRAAMALPAVRTSAGAGARLEETAAADRLCILVVDDEPAIRRTLVRFLGRRGHTVVEAAEGREALEKLEQQEGAAFDIIVSDLRMPGLGGDQLLKRLKERGDDMHRAVVFMTGDSASGEAEEILADADVPVILKPFELSEIASVIEEHARR